MEKKCSYPWKKLPVVNFCGSLARKEKKEQGNNEAFVTLSISLHSRWAEFLVL